jgi:dTDP-3-amino-3,4,6-trideoxy-alpha-D-glucose transaminase
MVAPQRETEGAASSYHLYVIATAERDRLARGLAERGIGNRVYYSPPLHRQPGMAAFAPAAELAGADRFAATCLAIPAGPTLSGEQAASVVGAVRETLGT